MECKKMSMYRDSFGSCSSCEPPLLHQVQGSCTHQNPSTTSRTEHFICNSTKQNKFSKQLTTATSSYVRPQRTRSQAVANSTSGAHVTSSVTWPFDGPYAIYYWWSFGTKPLSLTVSEIFNIKCNALVDVTLIRPLNKGQGHSFWYQSISHIRLPIGCQ